MHHGLPPHPPPSPPLSVSAPLRDQRRLPRRHFGSTSPQPMAAPYRQYREEPMTHGYAMANSTVAQPSRGGHNMHQGCCRPHQPQPPPQRQQYQQQQQPHRRRFPSSSSSSEDDQWHAVDRLRRESLSDPSLSPLTLHHHHQYQQQSQRASFDSTGSAASDTGTGSPMLPTMSSMLHHTTWSGASAAAAADKSVAPQHQQQQQHPTRARTDRTSSSMTNNNGNSNGYALAPSPIRTAASAPWGATAMPARHVRPVDHHHQLQDHPFSSKATGKNPQKMAPRSPQAPCSSPSSSTTLSVHEETHARAPATTDTTASTPSASTSTSTTTSTENAERKNSRYLREMDRRAILERLARGEKQATLAKEYFVSRAAICNLFKHRVEVMSRTDEDPFAKHPKKRKNKKTLKNRRSRSLKLASAAAAAAMSSSYAQGTTTSATSTSTGTTSRAVVAAQNEPPSRVHQVQTDAVLLLLTVMSDRRSSADEFRRTSERVLWLLVEEALAVVPIQSTQFAISKETKIMGVVTEHPPCAISMEQHGSPMLEVFQLLEPDRPFGHIWIDTESSRTSFASAALGDEENPLRLSDARLPATLKYHNVFLFEIAVVSSDTVRAMIECAKARGALEVMIYIVTLFISAQVVETLELLYPHVRIVTTQIESHIMERDKNRRSCVDVVLGRFDQVYQTQYTFV